MLESLIYLEEIEIKNYLYVSFSFGLWNNF